MKEFWRYVRSVFRHFWYLMATIFFAGIRFIPAIKTTPIPQWVYWTGMSISLFFAFFFTWRDEYRRAEGLRRELDEIYADVILDWLQQSCPTPAFFPAQFLADKLQWDADKTLRGLKILEKEFKVVRDDGAAGWSFSPVAAIRLRCNLRKIL